MKHVNNKPQGGLKAWWVVGVLIFAYTVSFVDRMIISLLVDPIKADLGVSDFQISLLQGIAFALFYTLLGIPIGHLADRKPRKTIIAYGVALWSAMTALCGLAQSYLALFLARVGVGVGEAALSPTAYSLIGDIFPRERVGRAISVYSSGIAIGTGLAFLLGGAAVAFARSAEVSQLPFVGSVSTWQLAFLIVAAPGILVLLLFLTFEEPQRSVETIESEDTASFSSFVRLISKQRAFFLPYLLGIGTLAIATNGFIAWAAPLYARIHGWDAGTFGPVFGLIVCFFGSGGLYFGALVAERIGTPGSAGGPLKVLMGSCVLSMVPLGLVPFVGPTFGMACLALATGLLFACLGVGPAGLQLSIPAQMRAKMGALYLLTLNLIGLGLGPTAVAVCTEWIFGDPAMVGYSIALVSIIALSSACVMLFAAQRYQEAAVPQ